MATAPQIKLRDGSGYTKNLEFSTNQETVVIEGLVDSSTADIQVSINGGAFVSDPTLVKFDLPSFVIPNQSSYPDGIPLEAGLNTILIRTIDTVGGVSGSSSVTITKVRQVDSLQVQTPTGVRVRRKRNSVDILASVPSQRYSTIGAPLNDNFRGFNFYGSTTPGGTSGYYRINSGVRTVRSTVFEEDLNLIATENTTFENTGKKNLLLRLVDLDLFGVEGTVRLEKTYDVSSYNDSLRFQSTLEDYRLIEFIGFNHVRTGTSDSINDDQFIGVQDSQPIYYVVTSVYFNPDTGEEIESAYSQEVLGSPLTLDTNLRELPSRNQFQVVTTFVSAIQRLNSEISLIPGSTTRDVTIDPFASEAERLYFLVDFVHKAQSFLTLLQIDSVGGSGSPDPVSTSAYKTALKAALGYSTDQAVQSLIDASFDKLAGNYGKKRYGGRPAIGQAVFYTYTKPTFNLTVPSGTIVTTISDPALSIPSVRFRVGGTYVLLASQAEAYYNFDLKRYEIVTDIVAETIGSDGNRPSGQIKSSAGVSGLSVTNTESTVFGLDRETNSQLTERCLLAFSSVDTGTGGGYASTAIAQVGVLKSKIVKSGDLLMMRDYDPIRHKHIGGKVDIWIQGLRERQVVEQFAFTFEVARDIRCSVQDATNLIFRVQDSRVTENTPITEILDNITQGLGVRNVTQGVDYLLSGVQILDYQTFKLDPSIVGQVPTNVDDVISADYRFRVFNQFKFTFQPVRRVVSVVGEVSGALTTAGYVLYKTSDPLLEGESTISTDYLSINQVNGVPSGESIPINDEAHVLIGFQEEPLSSIGINTKTVRVFSSDRSVEYIGPTGTLPDFSIVDGTPTTPVRIVRTVASTIENGATVSVDYLHDENFTVTYVVNDLLQQLQQTFNSSKHATADVIVKQAIQNSLELETTVQLRKGATKDKTDPAIRSNASLETNSRLIGQGIAQSDLIRTIDSSEGVDYQVIPLGKMAYADGSRKLRESVSSSYVNIPSLSVGGNVVYILTSGLQSPTTDGGGLVTEHRGVFQDDEAMTLSGTLETLASNSNQAFIVGSSGATIQGYTDTDTLVDSGFTTFTAQQQELALRTANHVLVSLSGSSSPIDLPTNHKYSVSYIVRGDSGSKDISASEVEFVDLGNLTITFREATG